MYSALLWMGSSGEEVIQVTEITGTCPIWGNQFPATIDGNAGPTIIKVNNSARAGGAFEVSEQLAKTLLELDTSAKARLTTTLIDRRLQGDVSPEITMNMVEEAKSKNSLQVHERAERLLKYLVRHTSNVGDKVRINYHDQLSWGAIAWTESVDLSEVLYFPEYLQGMGWIDSQGPSGMVVQVEGFARVAEIESNPESKQAFVAMWIHGKTEEAFEGGIKPAIECAGYEAVRIDRVPNVNKIDDAIIANILKSRFIVADFTQGEDGARGSVYYEAGFAHGLKLPVIFTCHKDKIECLHFDTRQYAHIVWESPDDLRVKLLDKIVALELENPNKQSRI